MNHVTITASSDYLFKMILVGNTSVGKTCLLLRYTDDVFSESFISTIGVDFKIKTLEIGSEIAKVQLWDTAGQDRFKSIVSSFYRGADGLIVVYDVTDLESFEALPKWLSEAERYGDPECVKMMVGNKVDLTAKRVVNKQVAQAFADKCGMEYIETSAKCSSNVHETFTNMAHAILKRKKGHGLLQPKSLDFQSGSSSFSIGHTTETRNDNTWCFGGDSSCSTL